MTNIIDSKYPERIKNLFYTKTEEKVMLSILLKNVIRGKHFNRFADICCGDGELSGVFINQSDESTLLDISKDYYSNLKNRYKKAEVLIDDFRNVTFLKKFDAILFSHCIYYVPDVDWLKTIDSLLGLLNDGGELFLVMNRDEGDWWHIVNNFYTEHREKCNFYYLPSSLLADEIKKEWSLDAYNYTSKVTFTNISDMYRFITEIVLQIRDEEFIKNNECTFNELLNNLVLKNSGTSLSIESIVIKIKKKA